MWKGSSLVDLPPHVFDSHCDLIKHHDRAVGRHERFAAVWGKTEVSDTIIGQTILRMRREFGDDGRDQRVLRTIPRFGYRWVAEADEQFDYPPATPSQGAVNVAAHPIVDASRSFRDGANIAARRPAEYTATTKFASARIGGLVVVQDRS